MKIILLMMYLVSFVGIIIHIITQNRIAGIVGYILLCILSIRSIIKLVRSKIRR